MLSWDRRDLPTAEPHTDVINALCNQSLHTGEAELCRKQAALRCTRRMEELCGARKSERLPGGRENEFAHCRTFAEERQHTGFSRPRINLLTHDLVCEGLHSQSPSRWLPSPQRKSLTERQTLLTTTPSIHSEARARLSVPLAATRKFDLSEVCTPGA
jgi:hypothetical protein